MLLSTKNSRWPGAIWLLGCLLFVTTLRCEAQNLVPNPSFELIDSCPSYPTYLGFQETSTPDNWARRLDTPEYYNACIGSSDTVPGIPRNLFGYQFAQDGDAYVGMASYLPDDNRELISAELMETLVVGQTYYGSFWANAAYGGPQQVGFACDNFGMFLTTVAPDFIQYPATLPLPNHAQVFSHQVISDTANWTLVSGSFVADSAYHYLVLGNSFDNQQTSVEIIGPGSNYAYTLVDAVCLSANPAGCPMSSSILESVADDIVLGPNPARNELNLAWGNTRYSNLMVVDAIGRILMQQSVFDRNSTLLQTDGLANGTYQLILEGKKEKQVRKFVVLH